MVEEETGAPPGFSQCIQALSTVAKLWDEYLAEIAFDSSLTPAEFADLVERVPEYSRLTHDHVYRAIDSYLKVIQTLKNDIDIDIHLVVIRLSGFFVLLMFLFFNGYEDGHYHP